MTADRIFYVCGKKVEIVLLKAFDSIIDSHQSQDLRIVLLQIMYIITVYLNARTIGVKPSKRLLTAMLSPRCACGTKTAKSSFCIFDSCSICDLSPLSTGCAGF